jgi:hypothetical protein
MTCLIYPNPLAFLIGRLPAAFSPQTKILTRKSTRDDRGQKKESVHYCICRQALQNDEATAQARRAPKQENAVKAKKCRVAERVRNASDDK